MREFGRKTLSQVLGTEQDGEEYATILAHCDAGTVTDEIKSLADPARHGFTNLKCVQKSSRMTINVLMCGE